MKLGYLFLQVIVKKLFKMGMGTAQLTLSAQTIVFNNIKLVITLSLILKKSDVHSFDWHQLPVRNSTPDLSGLWIKILPEIIHSPALPSLRTMRKTKGESSFFSCFKEILACDDNNAQKHFSIFSFLNYKLFLKKVMYKQYLFSVSVNKGQEHKPK